MKLVKLELRNVPFSKLLKQELPTLAEEVINTVKKYDPVELDIAVGYNRLLDLQPTFMLLTQPYGAHPITPQLTPVREKCMLYARYIVYRMGVLMKENKYNLTPAMIESNILINRYLHRLDRVNRESQVYKQIGDFFMEVNSNETVASFFDEEDLTKDLMNLKEAYSDVQLHLMNRKGSIAARPKLTTKELSDPIVEALKYFFKEIEVAVGKCVFADDDPAGESDLEKVSEYELLINDLNETIRFFRNSINLRRLTNQRKAEGLEGEESNGEMTEHAVLPPITMMRSVSVGEGEEVTDNNFDEELDEKKTVASSSKHLQLPVLNN